jgi:hypothetical protein
MQSEIPHCYAVWDSFRSPTANRYCHCYTVWHMFGNGTSSLTLYVSECWFEVIYGHVCILVPHQLNSGNGAHWLAVWALWYPSTLFTHIYTHSMFSERSRNVDLNTTQVGFVFVSKGRFFIKQKGGWWGGALAFSTSFVRCTMSSLGDPGSACKWCSENMSTAKDVVTYLGLTVDPRGRPRCFLVAGSTTSSGV